MRPCPSDREKGTIAPPPPINPVNPALGWRNFVQHHLGFCPTVFFWKKSEEANTMVRRTYFLQHTWWGRCCGGMTRYSTRLSVHGWCPPDQLFGAALVGLRHMHRSTGAVHRSATPGSSLWLVPAAHSQPICARQICQSQLRQRVSAHAWTLSITAQRWVHGYGRGTPLHA